MGGTIRSRDRFFLLIAGRIQQIKRGAEGMKIVVFRKCLIALAFAFGLFNSSVVSAQPICSVGDHVSVYWSKPGQEGRWFPATVVQVNDTRTSCFVRYTGFGSEWDEWVGDGRLKRVSAPTPVHAPVPSVVPIPAPAPAPVARQGFEYRVAHVNTQGKNWVFVHVNTRFFAVDQATTRKFYTDLQSCVRGAKMAGDVVAVGVIHDQFRFWGPTQWRNYLSTLDMNWVNARINKKMTCYF
ncbi:MAG: hypothetical protein EAZ30_11865 [Betaproteobacteria bacterium]|nr:MAG: hypothetical protein EAZ30_11865 [Betaproteobacteria bacterium]